MPYTNKGGFMKDGILVYIATLAENKTPFEQGITLIVGGFLVSGYIISYEKYLQQDQITGQVGKALAKISNSETGTDDELADNTINFIHLRDAKYFSSGDNNLISGNLGVFVRIALSSVHGYHLGVLNAESKCDKIQPNKRIEPDAKISAAHA
jgi:hypothetical protein